MSSGASQNASELDARMRQLGTAERAEKEKQYLKSDLEHYERRFVAAVLLGERSELLSASDLPEIGQMLHEARTWALVDTLVPHPVGDISERDPAGSEKYLDSWATDDDFWMRRSALLAHLVPLREGRGDWTRFTRYADRMLAEKEFFIQKAIGWILRDTSRKRPSLVRDWVAPRTGRMSGVTIREAVKRLDPEDRDALVEAYRQHRPAG